MVGTNTQDLTRQKMDSGEDWLFLMVVHLSIVFMVSIIFTSDRKSFSFNNSINLSFIFKAPAETQPDPQHISKSILFISTSLISAYDIICYRLSINDMLCNNSFRFFRINIPVSNSLFTFFNDINNRFHRG